MGKAIDHYSNDLENIVILGDFNYEEKSPTVCDFLDVYNLKNLIKVPTCFKSDNPRSIDLILTNRNMCFKHTSTIETGLSDFHTMIVTVLKGSFVKKGPKIIRYRNYSKFNEEDFRKDLIDELLNLPVEPDYSTFNAVVEKVLNVHAPLKTKYVRANDGPFMTKALRKATMLKTHLRNIYNKERTLGNCNAFKKQRNKCVKTLRQAKRDYYGNLDVKSSITDNRKFWKTVKPLYSEKVQTSSDITLVENGTLVSDDFKVAEIMNDYFVNITETLGISKNADNVPPLSTLILLRGL